MPNVDGFELVSRIRRRFSREEVAVMGVSSSGTTATSVGFLKHGANDFLPKPYQKEEFYCRVYSCIDTVTAMRAVQRAAFTDALTGLRNRLNFFRLAPEAFSRAAAEGRPMAVAMLDIDFFKKVNDTYGHAAGDATLRSVARIARRHLEGLGLFARFGGEEFCFLGTDLSRDAAQAAFEAVRAEVEASVVEFEGRAIRVTLSSGIALTARPGLDATLGAADELLYEAKHSGRNRVVLEPEPAAS
jgi:diguanylate cyclase (GGDEF)-like protein